MKKFFRFTLILASLLFMLSCSVKAPKSTSCGHDAKADADKLHKELNKETGK